MYYQDKCKESRPQWAALRDFSGPKYWWALKMAKRPKSYSYAYKLQGFWWAISSFEILTDPLVILMGLRILNLLHPEVFYIIDTTCNWTIRRQEVGKRSGAIASSYLSKLLSKSCRYSAETAFTPLILDSNVWSSKISEICNPIFQKSVYRAIGLITLAQVCTLILFSNLKFCCNIQHYRKIHFWIWTKCTFRSLILKGL